MKIPIIYLPKKTYLKRQENQFSMLLKEVIVDKNK